MWGLTSVRVREGRLDINQGAAALSASAAQHPAAMAGNQLPLVTPGLAVASALPQDDEAGPLCRICFGPDESDASGNIADQLISPCKCSGAVLTRCRLSTCAVPAPLGCHAYA